MKITIIPFKVILKNLKDLFVKKGLEKKNFQDPRYRAIAYLLLEN